MEEKEIKKPEEQQNASKEQQTPSTFWFKAKQALNKAQTSRYIGLLGVLVATVVISLYSVGWDPNKIGWSVFIANVALLLFLGIYGLFFGEGEGTNFFKKSITGAYQATRDLFLKVVDLIQKKNYTDALPDYIVWRYEQDYKNTCKMKMLSVRLFDHTVLDLSDEQIEELRHHPIKINDNKYYSMISQKQYEVIQQIKNGEVFVDYIDDYNFFLNDESTDGEQQATRVKNTNKRKEKITWKQRLSRILMIVVVALIVAGFIKEMHGGGTEEAHQEAIRNLISRLSTLVVSIASGINTARLLNLEDIFVLKFKTSYNSVFLTCMENGSFAPMNVDEKAKKDYEEYEKKEKEAAAKVIIPEVIDDLPELENKSNQIEMVK